MLNWCTNRLEIDGEPKDIALLPWNERVKNLLFHTLVPCPQNLTATEQYVWAIENWGIRWDSLITISASKKDYLQLHFDTPWNPPLQGIDKIAKMFPCLNFCLQSAESGCDWQGSFIGNDGELVEESSSTYFAQSPSICPDCDSDYFPELICRVELFMANV